MDSTLKIIICGGGVISAATSYYLTHLAKSLNRKIEVNIIERCSIACSSSGKAGGFLALDWCENQPIENLARASFNLHARLAKKLDGESRYGYRRVTTLEIQVSDEINKGKSRIPPEVKWFNEELYITSDILGTPKTTAQVDSFAFTNTLFEEAKSRGAKIVIGEVIGFEYSSEEKLCITGVKLSTDEVIKCDCAIIAMGAWSASLNAWFKYDFPSVKDIELPITGTRAHSVVFKLPEGNKNNITAHALFAKVSLEGNVKELEIYPRPNGHVYVCGESDGVILPYSADQIQPSLQATKNLRHVATSIIPELKNYEVVREQACYLPYSDTGAPLIGKLPNISNLYVAAGHSCWGMLNAPATGLSIAQLILTGQSSIDLSPFGLEST